MNEECRAVETKNNERPSFPRLLLLFRRYALLVEKAMRVAVGRRGFIVLVAVLIHDGKEFGIEECCRCAGSSSLRNSGSLCLISDKAERQF